MLLNADVGESFGVWSMGDDRALMPVIDMANIACGGHASDPVTMRKTVQLALDHGVTLGAHPSYPDLLGFGRRPLPLTDNEIEAHVLAQVGALDAIARAEGGHLTYVKPHGALYNTMMIEDRVFLAVMRAVSALDADLALMVLATPRIAHHQSLAAEFGLTLLKEAFADRRYTEDGVLDDRDHPGAVYHEWDAIRHQVLQLQTKHIVTARNGQDIPIEADVICVHGDNPESIRTAAAIKSLLTPEPTQA